MLFEISGSLKIAGKQLLDNIPIKSRRLRWASHVARMKEVMSLFKISSGTSTGKRVLRRLGVDEYL